MDDDAQRPQFTWDVRREGRAWRRDEFDARADVLVELKFEVVDGKVLDGDDTRLMVLAMLLENVGLDAAVRIGDPARWREALAALPEP